MTISPGPEATEQVGRGVAFSALAIPAGAAVAGIGFSLIPGVPFAVIGIAGVGAAVGAHWLYVKGAGTTPRRGLAGYLAIAFVAVLVTGFAGVVGISWAGFTAVGGRGGLFGSAFAQSVATRFRDSPGDSFVVIGLMLAGGVLGVVTALRRARMQATAAADAASTVAPSQPPVVGSGATAGAPVVPPAAAAPPFGSPQVGAPAAAPPSAPPAGVMSPGVVPPTAPPVAAPPPAAPPVSAPPPAASPVAAPPPAAAPQQPGPPAAS